MLRVRSEEVIDKLEETATGSSALTVERAADVLLQFANTSKLTLGVTEIANSLGLSKAAVHRILSSLKNKGIVEIDPESHRYALGPVAISLGLSYLSKSDVVAIASDELRTLSLETNETATLSVRRGFSRMYVHQVTPNREVLMSVQIGISYPLHAGASSKAFLAFLPPEEMELYLKDPLDKVTSKTLTDPNELRLSLEQIRLRGWDQSFGERLPGAGSIAAPVFDHRGLPVAVVSVCGPADRLALEIADCRSALLAATGRISSRLGGSRFT